MCYPRQSVVGLKFVRKDNGRLLLNPHKDGDHTETTRKNGDEEL